MSEPEPGVTRELIEAFVRLARADFSVRLTRNMKRDTADTLAMFVNLIAEEVGRIVSEKEKNEKRLEDAVARLSESFLRLAAGDFAVRVDRSHTGEPLDVLAFLFNNTAAEVGDAVSELEKQRLVLEAILESMVEGVLLLDAAAVVQRSNGAFARLVGEDEAQALVGRRLGTLLAPTEQAFAGELPIAVAEGAFRHREVLFRAASGDPVVLSVSGAPHRAPHGELVGIVLVARDDRELKRAHAQLQLTDRLATMGTLAAGVAHEINNPLAFIVGNLDYLAEELEESAGAPIPKERLDEMLRALKATQGGAERVRQIVRDLKALSRVDEEKLARVELPRLADAAMHMVRNDVRHRARVVTEYGPTPAVEANEARLIQVLLNLLQNAAHAIPVGRVQEHEIRVRTGTDPSGSAWLEVRDTGDGIPESVLPRIFDAFFTTKAVGVGTGLGLSICHKIVTSMGGRIEVESVVGEGTTFRVVLPPWSGQSRPARPSSRPPPALVRRRVLVVDDEHEVGDTFARILGREHDVVSVTCGDAALRRIDEERFDVVFCDLMMPEMTGIELYERIAKVDPALAARIVFMTGGSFDPRMRAFLETVPNGLIDKPFDSRTLRTLVARAASP